MNCAIVSVLLSYAYVLEIFRILQFAIFIELPRRNQMIIVDEAESSVVHMTGGGAREIRGVEKLEFQFTGFRIVSAGLHARLVPHHTVMRQQEAVAVRVIYRLHAGHLHTGLLVEAFTLDQGGAPADQLK